MATVTPWGPRCGSATKSPQQCCHNDLFTSVWKLTRTARGKINKQPLLRKVQDSHPQWARGCARHWIIHAVKIYTAGFDQVASRKREGGGWIFNWNLSKILLPSTFTKRVERKMISNAYFQKFTQRFITILLLFNNNFSKLHPDFVTMILIGIIIVFFK